MAIKRSVVAVPARLQSSRLPNKVLAEVDLKSVKTKWKDKGFARGVNRDDIVEGAGLKRHQDNRSVTVALVRNL